MGAFGDTDYRTAKDKKLLAARRGGAFFPEEPQTTEDKELRALVESPELSDQLRALNLGLVALGDRLRQYLGQELEPFRYQTPVVGANATQSFTGVPFNSTDRGDLKVSRASIWQLRVTSLGASTNFDLEVFENGDLATEHRVIFDQAVNVHEVHDFNGGHNFQNFADRPELNFRITEKAGIAGAYVIKLRYVPLRIV